MSRDGNGTVDFPEFLNMVARQMVEDDSSNDLKQAFDLFDENGDGFIRCWAPDMICGLIYQALMSDVQPARAAAGADQHGHQRHRGEGGEDDAAGGPGRGRAHQLPGVCGHDDQVIVS